MAQDRFRASNYFISVLGALRAFARVTPISLILILRPLRPFDIAQDRPLRLNSEYESSSNYVTFEPFVVNCLLRLRLCRASLSVEQYCRRPQDGENL